MSAAQFLQNVARVPLSGACAAFYSDLDAGEISGAIDFGASVAGDLGASARDLGANARDLGARFAIAGAAGRALTENHSHAA